MRFYRLALGFWRGESARTAWFLSLSFLACLFASMGLQVAVTRWNKYFFDALQARDMHVVKLSIFFALGLALATAIVAVLLIQSRMRLQLRWRTWLTNTLVARWLTERRFYQLTILRGMMQQIAGLCGLNLFSTEIALDNRGQWQVVDYVNDPCDYRLKSKATNGVPDNIVADICDRVVGWAKKLRVPG